MRIRWTLESQSVGPKGLRCSRGPERSRRLARCGTLRREYCRTGYRILLGWPIPTSVQEPKGVTRWEGSIGNDEKVWKRGEERSQYWAEWGSHGPAKQAALGIHWACTHPIWPTIVWIRLQSWAISHGSYNLLPILACFFFLFSVGH